MSANAIYDSHAFSLGFLCDLACTPAKRENVQSSPNVRIRVDADVLLNANITVEVVDLGGLDQTDWVQWVVLKLNPGLLKDASKKLWFVWVNLNDQGRQKDLLQGLLDRFDDVQLDEILKQGVY